MNFEITGYKDKHEAVSDKGVKSITYLIDCNDFMKQIPDKYFELSCVDPPYGIGETFISNSTGDVKMKCNKIHKDNYWNHTVPEDRYFNELKRCSQKQIIWGANYFNCFSEDGGAVIWYKNRGSNTLSECEIASVSFQKKVDIIFLQVLTGFVSNEVRVHPTQKPIELYKKLLVRYAKPGDKIFDSHMGSQSSRIACWDGGFDYWGCELDEDYFRDGCKRFENHIKQLKIF